MNAPKTAQEKRRAIRSRWWRRPLEALFSDKVFDGQFQNPGTEQVFDFDDLVILEPNPFTFIENNIVYYPPGNEQASYTIFIPGLEKTEATSSKRSRRYAARLCTGIANLNNATYLKQNPILKRINPFMDWIDAALHRLGLSGSPVIDNCARLVLVAIHRNQAINFSANSHGTILLGRGLRTAKKQFILSHTSFLNFKRRRYWEKRWNAIAHQFINVFAFGNCYRAWVKGPKYIMVSISGDHLTSKIGIEPKHVRKDSQKSILKSVSHNIQFLIFDSIFEPGEAEAHNIMYTIELLRQSFIKNNLRVGDFAALYQALSQGRLKLVTAAEAKSKTFPWPKDIEAYSYSATNSALTSRY
ncbi:MAG: hypothetical protein AAF810_09215 [Cyanobacteria bacterium P01_D01_bin.36]